MTNNKTGVNGCTAVCKAIQAHSTIREFYFSNNMIGPDGAKHLAKVLEHAKYITELWISSNGIFPESCCSKHLLSKNYSYKITKSITKVEKL